VSATVQQFFRWWFGSTGLLLTSIFWWWLMVLAGLLQFEIFFLRQNSIDAFLSSFLQRLCNQIANVDLLLIPEASSGLHELDSLVGCSLLRSKWSEFSCRRLLRKGLVQ
jgi:hypothetical protein